MCLESHNPKELLIEKKGGVIHLTFITDKLAHGVVNILSKVMQKIVEKLGKELEPYQFLCSDSATCRVLINLNWDLDHQAILKRENFYLEKAQLKL